MIKAKVHVITGDGKAEYQPNMNDFLSRIDARQIIKTETHINGNGLYRTIIYYINLEDIREYKIDSVLKF